MLASTPATAMFTDPAWCLDAGTADSVIARRNVLLGLWAGRMIGLQGDALTDYAREMVLADLAEAGDEDLVRKLHIDLAAHGIDMPPTRLRRQIRDKHVTAYLQITMTD
jgi:hypothetical protein